MIKGLGIFKLFLLLILLLTGCSVFSDKAEVEELLNKSQSAMQKIPIYIDYKLKMTSSNLPKEKIFNGSSDVHLKIHYVDNYNVTFQALKKIKNNMEDTQFGKEQVYIDGYHWYYEGGVRRGNERLNVTKVLISRLMSRGEEFLVSKAYHFNRAKKLADQLEVKDEGDTYLIEGDIKGDSGIIAEINKTVSDTIESIGNPEFSEKPTKLAQILDHEYWYAANYISIGYGHFYSVRFEGVNMKLWIDKKTHLLKKVETTSKMIKTYKIDGNTKGSYHINMKETFEYKKAPNTIPKPHK